MKKLCSILLALCVMAGFAVFCAVPAAAEVTNPYAPPANLDELTQAEQLAYFNLVVNRVREEKPGFQQRERTLIDSVRSGSALIQSLSEGIIAIVASLFSTWEQSGVAAGQSNEGLFLSENANASDLRPEDIISISCVKEGDNWVIALLIKEETDPAPGLGSANARIASIITKDELIEGMTEVGVTADPADMSARHFNGFASVTVNEQGKVIAAANGYQVCVEIDKITISTITTIEDTAITLNMEAQYAYFDWAPEEGFPDAHFDDPPPRPTPLKWWQRLPRLFQFVLRWFFFGWLWMR